MLSQDAAVTGPIRDLMVGTHAAAAGSIAVKATAGEVAHIQFERLEKAVADRNLIVKSELLQPRPKDASQKDIPPRFVIRGCAVGAALPYLRKFKEALGGSLEVVAPKFEHAIGAYSNPGAEALYEFLAYEFFLNRPTALATDKDIVGAFVTEGLLHYDGKPIEAKTWAQWIPVGSPPQNMHVERKYFSKVANRDLLGFAFFNSEKQDFPGEPVIVTAETDPGTHTARGRAAGTYQQRAEVQNDASVAGLRAVGLQGHGGHDGGLCLVVPAQRGAGKALLPWQPNDVHGSSADRRYDVRPAHPQSLPDSPRGLTYSGIHRSGCTVLRVDKTGQHSQRLSAAARCFITETLLARALRDTGGVSETTQQHRSHARVQHGTDGNASERPRTGDSGGKCGDAD